MPSILPPCMAASFKMLELKNTHFIPVMRKHVSISGSKRRFIMAIWNSYSKSVMARKPLRTTAPFWLLTYSTRRPGKLATVTLG